MTYRIEPMKEGSVTSPRGFQAGGVHAGIKPDKKLDLGLLVSQVRCPVAGIFTTNRLKGASLQVTQEHLQDGHGQAVLVNSGNANACTGERGLLDAREMARSLSRWLKIPGQDVFPNSTGVIGEYLPLGQLRRGIEEAYRGLSEEGGEAFARAIMTTDTVAKFSARKVITEGLSFTIGGVAKGSGMIHPNMATMMVYLTTDARLSKESLQILLKETADRSFNRFTVDGDTSCCDTVFMMANGLASGIEISLDESEASQAFREALQDLCMELTLRLAHDGEGVSHVAKIRIKGAPSQEEALRMARSIAVSPLVKTAINGQDPNWGRIINAAGYSGVAFEPAKVNLWIGDVRVMTQGERASFVEEEAAAVMRREEYEIVLDLQEGNAEDFYITTDFSHGYIDINADYRHRT